MLLPTLLLALGCRAPDPPPADQAVVLFESAPEALDRRFTLSSNGQRLASLVMNGLLRIDDDGLAVPDLAASYQSLSPTVYRFVLRDGLTFHDGTAVDSADVVATFDSLRDPAVGSPLGSKYQHIRAVRAVDPLTVDIELEAPFPAFLIDLQIGIAPEHLAFTPGGMTRPIGAGPFRFVARPDEEHIELAAFAGYYAGPPPIPRLQVVVVRDETTRVLTLLNGDADLLLNGISPVLLPRLERAPNLRIDRRHGSGYAYFAFNLRHEILADLEVRQAFAHAIDRDALARYKFKGAATPTTGMLPVGHWAYAPATEYRHDPQAAKALLDAAGYPDPDGDGPAKRFTITYKTSTDRFRGAVALALKQQLEAVGIGVDLRAYEWGTFYGDVKRGRFEVVTLKWTPVIEPHLLHWVFHSTSIPTEANDWTGGNRGGYANPEVDRLLDLAAATSDVDQRRAAYREVQRILGDELPYVPLWHEATVAVRSTRLEGFALSPFGFLDPLAGARLR